MRAFELTNKSVRVLDSSGTATVARWRLRERR